MSDTPTPKNGPLDPPPLPTLPRGRRDQPPGTSGGKPAKRPKHQVFISFSTKNLESCKYIFDRLEEEGFGCWISEQGIKYGAPWETIVTEQLHAAYVFVVLLSDDSMSSPQVQNEVTRAVKRLVKPHCLKIVPFHIDSKPLRDPFDLNLGRFQTNQPTDQWREQIDRLVEGVRSALEQSAREREEPVPVIVKRRRKLIVRSAKKVAKVAARAMKASIGGGLRALLMAVFFASLLVGAVWLAIRYFPRDIPTNPTAVPFVAVPKDNLPEPSQPKSLVANRHAVIEVGAKAVRAIPVDFELKNGVLKPKRPKEVPAGARWPAEERLLSLIYDRDKKSFDGDSVSRVVDATRSLADRLVSEQGVKRDNIHVVFSSGAAPHWVGETARSEAEEEFQKVGLSRPINVVPATEEAEFLYLSVVPEEEQKSASSPVLIDIGSGNFKSVWVDAGIGSNLRFPYASGGRIPGTRTLYKEIEPGIPAEIKPYGESEVKRAQLATYLGREARTRFGKKIHEEINDGRLPGIQSATTKAYLTGDVARALCRLTHPNESPDTALIQLQLKTDLPLFRSRLIAEWGKIGVFPPSDLAPAEFRASVRGLPNDRVESMREELGRFIRLFSLEELLTAAELLLALDEETGLSADGRTVVFVNGASFDWSIRYLEKQVNVSKAVKKQD